MDPHYSADRKESGIAENSLNILKTPSSKWIGLVAGLATTVGCALPGEYSQEAIAQHKATYGTLNNPKFRITKSLPLGETVTLYDICENHKKIFDTSEDVHTFEKLDKKLAALEQSLLRYEQSGGEIGEKLALQNSLAELKTATLNAHCAYLTRREKQINTERAELIEKIKLLSYLDNTDWSRFKERHGTSLELAHRLIFELTGRQFPDIISVDYCEFENKNLYGLSYENTSEIYIRPGNYAQEVNRICHEVGHLLALNSEHELTDQENVSSSQLRKARIRDEASAVAFALAGALAIPDPELSKLAQTEFFLATIHDATQFYCGDTCLFTEGKALYDAALTLFRDPARTFNYLASDEPLRPEILAVMEENRSYLEKCQNKAELDFGTLEKRVGNALERAIELTR